MDMLWRGFGRNHMSISISLHMPWLFDMKSGISLGMRPANWSLWNAHILLWFFCWDYINCPSESFAHILHGCLMGQSYIDFRSQHVWHGNCHIWSLLIQLWLKMIKWIIHIVCEKFFFLPANGPCIFIINRTETSSGEDMLLNLDII